MKFMSRFWALSALLFLFVSVSFADGPAAKKDAKSAKKPAAETTAKANGSPEDGASTVKIARPQAPAGTAELGKTADETPTWRPMPATTGGLGLFTIESGDTLPKRAWSFSAGVNKFSRMPGDITVLNTGFNIATGLTDHFTVYVQFDPNRHIHVDRPELLSLNTPSTGAFQEFDNTIYRSILPFPGARPAYVEDYPFAFTNGGGVGDVNIGLKVGIFSELRGDAASFALKVEETIPTHTGISDLLASEGQTGQYDTRVGMELSKTFLDHTVMATTDLSYQYARDPRFTLLNVTTGKLQRTGVTLADQFRAGVGFLMFPEKRFQVMSEYTGVIFTGDHTPNMTFGPRDPVDGVWGVRWHATNWLALDAGYRYMLNLTRHVDRNGFVIKLGSVYWPEKVVAPDVVEASCTVDKTSLIAESGETVQASVRGSDTYNHPLNYTWTATGGTIEGSGPDVRWNPAGAAAGGYTLTARAEDGLGHGASCSAVVTVQPKPIPPPTMSCSVDRSTVLVGERPQVTAAVNDQSGTPLTYTWQSNGGQIVGSGATVQLDTTGLAPGSYTVTGRVQNGKGMAADCSTSVTVQAPPPPPQASKINECFFRHGSGRVDNICKRVLDDVAVRLQNDPKAKVVVVGYADPKERRPEKLANDRAGNARTYLAEKKGVASTRIDVRSAGGQAGAGKQNYRIDVIWVPEGATY